MRMSWSLFRIQKKRSGFTLIELLVVVAIIGLLATAATVQYNRAQQKAKALKILSDFKTIEKGLILYMTDQQRVTWWSQAELAGAGTNDFTSIIIENPGLREFIPVMPVPNSGSYLYDNDSDIYDPDGDYCGAWNAGVGVYVMRSQIYPETINILDQMVDDGDGQSCGKIVYNDTYFLYKLANDENSSSF